MILVTRTWNINIHRDNSVTASDHGVRIVIVSSPVSTTAERHIIILYQSSSSTDSYCVS